ncbi:DoxX family protein [Arenibacter sp. ARW7G5Y1]|uniref:DoxX family protein n=1 Tax=Arenibacter sp. ARW7G5Y1 TaxID=2135619 RepID=UPI000D767121|nr:DoxX family protein [Arenibacter sp. ARW7G5Y1]PXX30531.1 DoxX-like protein [Arenibacter sp. ARW7G5Y1]|tara:strand:- start:2952 stop:3359 length:408 start_codon:yes stop_codon:yes gene_type:complete
MTNQKNNKAIHIVLWVAQGLLAAMFIMAGLMKASQPIEVLAESVPWVTEVSSGLVRFIGISELLGGLGLIIPSIFRFKTFLTVWAALGLAAVMVLAAGFHASQGEFSAIGMNIVLLAIALFIAWGRSKKTPILAK